MIHKKLLYEFFLVIIERVSLFILREILNHSDKNLIIFYTFLLENEKKRREKRAP